MTKLVAALCLMMFLNVACSSLQPCDFLVAGSIVGIESEKRPERDQVVAELGSVLKPFGFSGPVVIPHIEPEFVVYTLGNGFTLIGGDRIDVGFMPILMRVTVRDYNEAKGARSALDKKIVGAIQDRISAKFHSTLQFQTAPRCIM